MSWQENPFLCFRNLRGYKEFISILAIESLFKFWEFEGLSGGWVRAAGTPPRGFTEKIEKSFESKIKATIRKITLSRIVELSDKTAQSLINQGFSFFTLSPLKSTLSLTCSFFTIFRRFWRISRKLLTSALMAFSFICPFQLCR